MTYTAYPINKEQEKAIKAVFEALKVPYEKTDNKIPYNPEFVDKILAGAQEIKEGKGIRINVDDLWK